MLEKDGFGMKSLSLHYSGNARPTLLGYSNRMMKFFKRHLKDAYTFLWQSICQSL